MSGRAEHPSWAPGGERSSPRNRGKSWRNQAPGPATPRRASRSSRASRRCASAPACTSATPTTARVCTTWSTRWSTTPSTRRWPATASRDPGHRPRRRVGHRRGRRPRHPGGHAQGRGALGGRGRHDRAARRRQVRQQLLQGLRRPARRRRLGGQRAVRVARARDPARRQGLVSGLSSAACPKSPIEAIGKTDKTRHQGHASCRTPRSSPTLDFHFDTLAQRLRELAFLNRGVAHRPGRRAHRQGGGLLLRGRHRELRRAPEPQQDGAAPQAGLPRGRARRRQRRGDDRDRAAVERRLPGAASSPSPTTSTTATAAPTWRASGRRLTRTVNAYANTANLAKDAQGEPVAATTCARG